jgi:hypothetical protein
MRRLTSTLAGVLLAAGTVAASAGVASAGTTAVHRQSNCFGGNFFHVTKNNVSYYLGTPNNLSSGAAAILKPNQNSTTSWTLCLVPNSQNVLIENRGLALTSRSASPGADVTLESPGNGGNGFASQQWLGDAAATQVGLQNVKTGLWLRVRNSGPIMGQTVTTGSNPLGWQEF